MEKGKKETELEIMYFTETSFEYTQKAYNIRFTTDI